MKKLIGILLTVLALTLIIGCQTTHPVKPPIPTPIPVVPVVVPETNGIEPQAKGFSPANATMNFNLVFGNQNLIKDWKVEITNDQDVVVKTFTDTKAVQTLNWDGKTDAAATVPDGKYVAVLSIEYKSDLKPVSVQSQAFVLDATPPTVMVVSDSMAVTPDEKGGIKPIEFTISATSSLADVTDWTLSVFSSDKKQVANVSGKEPKDTYIWTGKIEFGNSVDPTVPYNVIASVKDEYGNSGQATMSLTASKANRVVMIDLTADKYILGGAVKTLKFNLSFGKLAIQVKSWKIELKHGNDLIRTLNNTGLFIPKTAEWDGKTDSGFEAPEGQYTATMTVNYGLIFGQAVAISAPFTVSK